MKLETWPQVERGVARPPRKSPKDLWLSAGIGDGARPEQVWAAAAQMADLAFEHGFRVHVRAETPLLTELVYAMQRHPNSDARLIVHETREEFAEFGLHSRLRIAGIEIDSSSSMHVDVGTDAMRHGSYALSFFVGSAECMAEDYYAACATPGNRVFILTAPGGMAARLRPMNVFGFDGPVFLAGRNFHRIVEHAIVSVDGGGAEMVID